MIPPLHVSLLGAVLAGAFAVPMGALLWWMLRVPRAVPQEVARAVRSVGAVQTILVPILEHYYSERAVELASRLGAPQKAAIFLGYVLEVPRTLSLGVPLPEAEVRANRALEQAKTIVALHNLEPHAEIIRARDAGEGIARVARDKGVDLIVLGISPDMGFTEGSTARTAESLFRSAPCEVIIDRLAETSIGASVDEPAISAGAAPRLPGTVAAHKEAPGRSV
ncbi:MAG TPA: universal stress protein [bacterium]|nr:universal stress protein [bacterium]